MLLSLSVLILIFSMINCEVSNEYLDSLYGESEQGCNQQGGMCILQTECNNVRKFGLCPSQPNFECCNGVPKSEIRCRKLGGECMKKESCKNANFKIERAQNCEPDEHCCLLIQ